MLIYKKINYPTYIWIASDITKILGKANTRKE